MKKIGVFLGVLFMGLLIFVRSPAPARADAWVLPFSKIPDILEMAQTLFSGGKLEFSSIISAGTSLDDVLEMWQDFKDRLAHAETQKRAKTTLSGMVDLTMQGITAIAPGTDFVIPFTFDDVNAFTLYNPYWYLQNIATSADQITENPDPNYLSYLDGINGSGFWFRDFPNTDGFNVTPALAIYPPSSLSWYCINHDFGNSVIQNKNYYVCAFPSSSIFITGSGNNYTFTVNIDPVSLFYLAGNTPLSNYGVISYYGVNSHGTFDTMNTDIPSQTYSYTGDLTSCLVAITNSFKNVSIYVNDVLWSWAGEIVLPPVGAPDVIQVGDTGQDTYDVYGLELPDDLGLDIPNFIDWILNKLKEGATTISLDDAVADEVPLVRTVDGDRAITYSDTRPIWEVIEKDIDIPADDPDHNPSPTPTPDPGDPPILKLPTFNYLPHNHDSTVLAELIDATQNTIPAELMNLIWNCFGLLVIGGLIFILHK